jgi:hypothetical protein
MENNFRLDIGEEIISKLKELIRVIEESKDNNGKKFTTTSIPRN